MDRKLNIDRRDFIKAAGAAGVALAGPAFATSTGGRPNILLILVDQMRFPRWFPQDARLPAYERLKNEGLSFSNHFTSAVPCSPSRACLLTGLHLPQHGVQVNMPMPGMKGQASLSPEIPTLGHAFQASGYRTPYFGKWHLSVHEDYRKVGLAPYGFEEWKGPDRDGWPLDGLMQDKRFTNQAIKWLEHNGKSKTPWFLTLSLINPHDIMFYKRFDVPPAMVPDVCDRLPDNFNDSLEGKPRIQKLWRENWGKIMGTGPDQPERVWRQYIDFYYYLTRKVDLQVKRTLEALDRLGLAEDTLVVFTSDHGEMAGAHMLQGKGPFVYNENNQVPLIMRWPGRIRPGAETMALTQSVDLFPTLIDLFGVKTAADQLPGRSFKPVLEDPEKATVNDHVLMVWGSWAQALNAGITRMIVPDVNVPNQVHAIHDGRYKYAKYFGDGCDDEFELYDLREDPLEMRNLAVDSHYARLAGEMSGRLLSAEKEELGNLSR